MSLEGLRINKLPVAATTIEPNDYFGIDQETAPGSGLYQTKKAKRKLLTDITTISRTTDLVRTNTGADDDQLFFSVVAGTKYYVRTRLIFNIGGPTASLGYTWTTPLLTSALQDILYFQSGAFVWKRADNSGGPAIVQINSDATSDFLIATDSLILVPQASGVVALNWFSVNTVTLAAGSWIDVVKQTP